MKKLVLFVLSVMLMLPVIVNAQTDYIVGTGTTDSYTGAFGTYYKYSWQESIYLASNIQCNNGGTITAIGWYSTSTSTLTTNTLKIYMGTTTRTTHSSTSDWQPQSELQLVYDGTNDVIGGVVGWKTFNLTTPFFYNGTDNLVVVVAKTADATSSTTKHYYTNTTAGILYRQNSTDITYANYPTTTGSTSYYLANIKLTINQGACPSPTPREVVVGPNTATLDWVNYNQSAFSFDLVYGEASTFDTLTGTVITNITDTFYSLTGLTSATAYKACIKSHCSTESGTWSAPRNFSTLEACPKPTQVTISSVGAYDATVTWTPGFNETSWELVCVPHGTSMSAGTPDYPTSTTYQITNLTPATSYDVYVRADCGTGEYSYWTAATTFATSCVPLTTLPFTENFDSYTGSTSTSVSVNNLPNCWAHINNGTSSSYTGYPAIYNSSSYAASGTNAMRFYVYTSTAYDDQIAILPSIDPIAYPMNTLQLSFDARSYSSSYTFTIVVGVMSNPTDVTTFVPVGTITTSTGAYENFEIPFSQYTGSGTFIAVRAPKPSSSYNWGLIDNIMVDLAPNCTRPSHVVLGGITTTSVTVDWTPTDSETAWEVAVVPQGQSLANATPEQAYTHPYTVSNLNDDTQYNVYVRGVCPTSGYSSWTSAVSFRTDPFCTPPTNVSVSQIRGTSALVTWNSALVGADSYTVEYSEHGMNNWVPTTVSATQYMLSGLTPQTSYDVMVYSNCQLGDADTVNKTFMTRCISGGEISIGNGTMTNEYIPSYSYYEDGYSQQIYLASELGGATTLSSIAFQLQALAQQRSYTIYLMHTTATSLSSGWIPTTGAQQVFSGAQTLVQGWNTFNFTTPFQYNGIDNLLVIVLDATGSYVDGNYWYTHSATGLARYVYQDGQAYSLTPPSDDPGELLNERNNVKFGGACDNTVTCVAPNAYVSGVTESSVTVDWAPGNTESSWQMEYSTDGTNWTQEGSVTAPHTLTSLNANTDYSIRLRSDCSGSYSDWTMVHAHTPCAAANIPLTESFDNATGSGAGNMVACWSTLTNSATAYPYTSTTYHHSGNYSVYFYGTSTTHAYLVSPRLDDAVSMNNLQVSFWAYKTSANYYIQVGVMTDPNDPNTFVQVGSNSSPSAISSWEFLDVNTTLYTGQGKYIAFRIPENISNGMYIDDINIDIVPNCIHVDNLHTTSVDSTNATISWTAGGSESYWDLYIMEGTGAVDLDTVVPISVSETTYVATGLQPGTVHTVYVRSNCGSEYSLWMSCNFLTTQTPGQMPYFCDFEDAHYQFGFANGTATNQWHVGTGANHGGTHALYISNDNGVSNSYTISTSSDVWAYRDIYFPACPDGYKFSFDWHSYGESCCDYMKVYLGDPMTPTAGSTAQPSGSTVMNPNVNSSSSDRFNITSGYQTFSYTIPGMTVGAIKRLYFYWHNDGSVGTMPPAAVDNISISPIYCTAPSNIAVSNVSAYGADVTWTAPATVTNFVVYYKADADAAWTIDNNATLPYSLTGLNPSMHYTVRVASDCGDGEHVSPFVTTDFITSCVPMTTIPYSENFDNYTGTTSTSTNVLPACWSRLNGGTSYTGLPTIYNSSSAANSGPNCLYFYTYTTSGTYADQYAILPEIDVTTIPLNTLQISMSAKPYSTSYPFVIQVGVMTDPTQASTFQLVQTISVTGSAHQQKEAYFSNYTGNGSYIALKVAKPSSGYNYGYIDDVVVSLIPNCSPVTNLTVSQIAGTSALLSWDAGHFGTVASYIVEYTEHGTNNWTPATSSATITSFMLGGLDPNTSYDVRVKTTCTDYSESDWVMETFNTKCLAGGEVAVGNGTSTDNYSPSYSCYNYAFNEQLYTAAEIGSAGNISSISFNAATVTATPRNWAVYLMPTTSTSLSGIVDLDATTAVKVYEGSVNITQGWFTINFTTPFPYDGVSNLILAIDDNTGSYQCTNAFYSHSSPTGGTYCLYTDDSSENPNPYSATYSSASSTSSTNRANVIFGMPCDSNATCVAPNIYVSGFTTNTATIEWVPGYLEGLWDMEYQVFGDTLWTSAGSQTTSPATLTNLLSGTRYNVRMRSDCGGGDVSNWVSAAFMTECDAVTQLPFTENFDSYNGSTSTSVAENNLPLCWGYLNGGTSTSYSGYPMIYNNQTYAESGTNTIRFYTYTTAGTYDDQIAILPPMDVTTNPMNTLQISFDARNNPTYTFQLVVGVMSDPHNKSTFVPIDTIVTTSNTYTSYDVPFNNYTGTGAYIALMAPRPATSYNAGYVDNVRVELIPTCLRPHDLTVTNITPSSATLGWTEMGTAYNWIVEYDTAGFTPGTGSTVQVQNTPSTTITGLQPNTQYDFHVMADCGGGDVSYYSSKASARTACNAVTIPYSENFDNMGSGSGILPPCWSGMNNYSTTLYPYISTSYHTSGNASLYFYCSSSTYNIAVLPFLDVTANPINTLQISFEMRSSSGTTSTITVGVMTNPLDANTFTPITQVNNSTTGTFESKEVSLSSYTGQGAYVALKLTNTSSTYSVYIDDILLETIPTCPRPTNLTATNATVNSISLSWTETGTAQNWEVEYGPMGFTLGQGTTVQVTGTPSTTITGLTASTTYDFYVKSDCGGGDVSINSAKLTVSTTMTPTALPYTSNFNSASDAWVLENGTCPNYWMKGTYSGSGALFVTNDGSTPSYNTSSSSMVSAQKLFAVGTSPNVTITFDVQVDGEGSYDYLKLFFAPPAQQYPASTSSLSSSDYGYHDYSTYAYNFYNNNYGTQSSHVYVLNKLTGTLHVQAVMDNPNTNPTANSTALLVFAWRNDGSAGTQPPAIITNLTVTGTGSGPAPTCDAPTGLAVGNLAQTTATANWTAGGTETAWDLQYKLHSASDWGQAISLTAHTYNFTGLTAGTQYDVRVRANCGSNNYSDWTTAVTFTTLNQGQDPCNDPTNLTATNVTSNSVVLDWTENGTATSWTVNYKEVNAANWSTTTASSKPYTLIGLQPETAYSAYVVANCTSGQSGATNTVTFTTESTGIADYELATTLYPNPTAGQFTIHNSQFTIHNVNVYDVYGKLLKTVEVNSNTAVIDAHELAAGMYFVRISTEKGVVTKSFVKK